MSRAWVELVGYHVAETGDRDFTAFASHHTALLDKRLLTRFYRPATLASLRARIGWVEPDLAPFPWQHPAEHQPAGLHPVGAGVRTASRSEPATERDGRA